MRSGFGFRQKEQIPTDPHPLPKRPSIAGRFHRRPFVPRSSRTGRMPHFGKTGRRSDAPAPGSGSPNGPDGADGAPSKVFARQIWYFENFAYLCTAYGGLAQLARALAWHARGHEFESRILHRKRPARAAFHFRVREIPASSCPKRHSAVLRNASGSGLRRKRPHREKAEILPSGQKSRPKIAFISDFSYICIDTALNTQEPRIVSSIRKGRKRGGACGRSGWSRSVRHDNVERRETVELELVRKFQNDRGFGICPESVVPGGTRHLRKDLLLK